MKKFMILLLSLAVLFSFAACDNSNDTPATEDPSGELVVNTPMLQDFASSINGLLSGSYESANADPNVTTNSGTKIIDLLDNLDEATFTANGETASVSTDWYDVEEPVTAGDTTLIDGSQVRLTVSGKYSRTENTGTVVLTGYTYEFSLNRKDSAGEYALLTGSFAGNFIAGNLTVNFENSEASTALSVTSDDNAIILLPVASGYHDVKIGDLDVTGEQLFNFVAADPITASADATVGEAYAYQTYVDVRNTELKNSLDEAVKAFMDGIDDTIIARFKMDSDRETNAATTGLISTTAINTANGTATIEYTYNTAAETSATRELMIGWKFAENSKLTIVFTDTDSETAGIQAGAYDIVATNLVYDTASSTSDKFGTVSIDINGLMATPTTFTAGTTATSAATIDSSNGSISFAGNVGTGAGQYTATLGADLVFEGSATGAEPTAICQSIDAEDVVQNYAITEAVVAGN